MRTLLITGLLLSAIFSKGQAGYKFKVKEHIAPVALMFLAGASDGLNQSITWNYKGFKKHFPNANNSYWSPQMSYLRKYKNGDKTQGERFLGSAGPLVFVTDGYHFTRFTEKLFIAGALTIKITQQKKNWKVYIFEGLGYWMVNRLGFCAVYNTLK